MKEDFRCPNCKKKDIRFRIKSKSYICNKCGHSWKINKEENNGDS